MSHLMDENSPIGLKPRAKAVLGFAIKDKEAVEEWLKTNMGARANWDFSKVPENIMDPYSGMDPYFTWKLDEHYWPSIQQHFAGLFETDMKVFDILYKMERNGLPLDLAYLKTYQHHLENRIETNRKEVHASFGGEFNLDSPMEVAEVLYDKMKIPKPVRPASDWGSDEEKQKRQSSTDDEALSQIDHPVARGIQQHRTWSKLLGTYVIPFQELGKDGVLHGDYALTRTKTGRFSCSDPNLQNLVKDEGLRRAFIVAPGDEAWFWDQSQIEMIGFAKYSKDAKMCAAIKEGSDLHAMTAQEVLGRPNITKEERAMGKGTNFSILFGVGKAKLAGYISQYVGKRITDKKAADFKAEYLKAFPSVYQFQQLVMRTVKQHREPWGNFVKNSFGRVRRIEPDKAYTGVNHLIQGWAADLMKASMVKIEEKYHPKWRQNIHDAIRIDVPRGDNADFVRDVARLLTDWPDVGLPIKCTTERTASNWAELEEMKL
jgi:DNA polymerase-1